ncbi:MAG: ferrous iron transport protein B [Pseudomonadota bacterium]
MSRQDIYIALAGNPNAGKTSLFNAITGARQHVGNYPGVTVEKKEGTVKINGRSASVVDLPGSYSLTAYSQEEVVVREYLLEQKPDVVIDVVDASNLERNLYLAVQLLELGAPVIIALNMVDLAEKRGIKIDVPRLSELLGVPVVETVARASKGVDRLLETALAAALEKRPVQPLAISYGPDIDQAMAEIVKSIAGQANALSPLPAAWAALKCLEGDAAVLKKIEGVPGLAPQVLAVIEKVRRHIKKAHDSEPEGVIAEHRYGRIAAITREAVTRRNEMRLELSDKIDQVLTNSFIGPLFLFAVLYGVYQFVFWASETPVGWVESFFGWLGGAAQAALPEGLFQSLLISGVIDGVGGVLGFAPLIMFMFFAVALLEDTGYMARVAYLLDRALRMFGLHGNSVVALIVGGGISGGCAVPGVMAARTLNDPKARLATILTVPLMNCGAKLPVFALLIAAFFADRQADMMFALTLISWGLALAAARVLRWTVLRGASAPFVMELPPYRLPTLKGLLIHMWERTWLYIKKAGTVILGVSILIWASMTFPGLPKDRAASWDAKIEAAATEDGRTAVEQEKSEAELEYSLAGRVGRGLSVVTAPLGFDWRTNVALVGGFAAKEVIVSTLGTAYSLGEVDPEEVEGLSDRLRKNPDWSPLAAFALMIFVMVYAPCFVTVVVMAREAGWRWALFSVVYTTGLAYVLALGVFQGGRLLGLG